MSNTTAATRTQLGVNERDRLWKSTLNGAEYRWDDLDGWQVRFSVAPDWHPVRSMRRFATLFSYAGEKFVEVGSV
jgi:hypothetical protein